MATLKTTPVPSPLRILSLGVLAWLAYIAARTGIQILLPVSDMATYLEQDAVITVLRLSTLGFCYWLGRLRYPRESFQNLPGRSGVAWVLGLWMTAAFTLSWFARTPAPFTAWNAGSRLIEAAIALIVAANEEVGWRATMFEPLRETLGATWAVSLTTLGFLLMHVGYQPWQAWPRIAFTALAFGLGRLRGLSLGSLIAIHFACDASMALYQPEGTISSWDYDIASAVMVAAAAGAIFFMKPKADA